MNVGVIGTGTMGKNHARIYSELKGIEETYVFDANKTNANEIEDFGAIACDSMEELLDNVDALSICVPTKYHYQVAKEVIERDIHCLIEKPIAQSVDEAEKLVALLKTKNLVAGVGHIERFNPIVADIRKIIKNPFFVELRRHNPASSRITDASVIEDLMIHDIDILFNVFFAKKNYTMHSVGNFDVCKAMVAFNGSVASLSASRKASKKIRTIYIEEEDFTIEGDFMTQEIYTYNKPEKYGMENDKYTQENIIEKVLVNKVEPLKVELKTYIDCVKKNSEFPITPEQALNNLRICEEIKKGFK
ncbi:UDP-N-acetylglucosamine 3-dehydrogenase [uncultured archaeon]|nr:UDP-N-acetylglucosamine 3-dehydrogenase [uncultured archaeon]